MLAAAQITFAVPAFAIEIDNDLPVTQQGHWRVDILDAGESRNGYVTAVGTPSGTVFQDEEIVYDYFSYIDTGSGAVRLSNSVTSPAAVTGDDEITSSGSFTGSGGNTIDWTVVSSIASGSAIMVNEITFTARTGTLGNIRFYQYLDEDVLSSGDDIFFTRGSVATNDLQLYTIDNAEAFGVSHCGACSEAAGLENASFAGWAACEYDEMRPAITSGTQNLSLTGVICPSLASEPINHPVVGAGYGPIDVVSTFAWDIDPNATQATIVSTLGGVPDIGDIEPPVIEARSVPTLSQWAMLTLGGLLALWGMATVRRQQG